MSTGRTGMSRLTRNILESVVGQGILFVLGFVATRYINRRLGADVLGLYYLSLAIAAVSSAAVEMGVSTSVVREVANHRDTDRAYVRQVVGTAGLLYWAAFLALTVLLWVSAPFALSQWVTLEALSPSSGWLTLRLFTIAAFLGLPRLLYASVLQGMQRFGTSNSINVGLTASQQVGTLFLLERGVTPSGLATWYFVSSAVGVIASMLSCAWVLGLGVVVPRFSRSAFNRNVRFAGSAMATSLFSALLTRADRFILGSFLPMASLGHYGVAQTVVQKVLGVVNSVELAGYPALARAHKDGELVRQVRKVDDAICLVTLPGFAAVVFAEPLLLGYVFDPGVARRLLLPTALLSLGSFMNATISVPYRATLAVGRPELAARLNFHALFVVLPATIALVWKLGMVGAGLAWVFYHLFAYVHFVPSYSAACLGFGPWPFYWRVGRILAVGTLVFGGTWGLLAALGSTSLLAVVGSFTTASAIWILVAYRFLASDDFRISVDRALRGLRRD